MNISLTSAMNSFEQRQSQGSGKSNFKARSNRLATAAMITVALSVTACSSTPTKAERDTSGKYEGDWIAQVQTANSPQRVHNWILTCKDLSRELKMKITDGEVSVNLNDQSHKSYIGTNGKFKILIDAGKTRASDSSPSSLSNPNVRISIQGNLGNDPAKGTLIVGLAEVGFAGCKSPIDYRKA